MHDSHPPAKRFIRLNRFRKLFEQHSAIIVIFEAETGLIVEANKAAVSFYGWSLGELKRKSFGEICVVPEDLRAKGSLLPLEIPSAEFKQRLADGTVRDVAIFSNRFESSSKTFIYTIIQDITDRRQIEARYQATNLELQQRNEELLRKTEELKAANIQLENEKKIISAVMEALPIGISITDKEGGFLHTNKAFNEVWSGPRPETRSIEDYSFYKAWWSDTNNPVAPEEWASTIAVKTGQVIFGQMMRIQRFDGSEIYVMNSAAPIFDTNGEIVGSVIVIEDITHLKLVEQALYEREQHLRLFIRHAPAAIAMFDRDMRYLSASLRWSQDNDLGDLNLIGRSHYEIFPDVPERWKEDHRRGLAGEVMKEGVEPYQRAGGPSRWLRREIRPWYTLAGEIGGIVIFVEDVTARRQQELQLQTVNEELEQRVKERTRELIEAQHQFLHAEKLAEIGKLSASIAHEINNPLQAVLTILKCLSGKTILEEQDGQFVEMAIGEGNRIKGLIRSLQDFYRPSSRKKSMLDINSTLDLLLLLQKSDLKKKRIAVERDYTERLPIVSAVADQVKQVFLNLLTNAKEACLPGGTITLITRQQGEQVAITFKDTGVGIQPEQMDQIFRPFYTTKPEIKGTGLGLSVSYGIVKSHGGEISVASTPGQGAIFTVVLPIRGESELFEDLGTRSPSTDT